jgi:hypothetical protein
MQLDQQQQAQQLAVGAMAAGAVLEGVAIGMDSRY